MSIVPAHWPPRNQVIDRPAEQKADITQPPLYTVFLIADPVAQDDIILATLTGKFNLQQHAALDVMAKARANDKAAVAQFPRDLAESKAASATDFARLEHSRRYKQVTRLGFTFEQA